MRIYFGLKLSVFQIFRDCLKSIIKTWYGRLSIESAKGRGDAHMYSPRPLAEQAHFLSPRTQALIARAEYAVIRAEEEAVRSGTAQALNRVLSRVEALSSVRIEGKRPSMVSLCYLEALLAGDGSDDDRLAALDVFNFEDEEAKLAAWETFNYIKALDYIYQLDCDEISITPEFLLTIHSIVRWGRDCEESGTSFRRSKLQYPEEQATSRYYKPPCPEQLSDLLQDLCAFANDDLYTPVSQSAIAHFQLESIKPFKTGLDKTGRLMCHAIMRRRGLMRKMVSPIGLEPAVDTKSHASFLLPYSQGVSVDEQTSVSHIGRWVDFCAYSADVAARTANVYSQAILNLRNIWRAKIGKISRGSAVEALISVLSGTPAITVKQAVALTGKGASAVSDAIARLEQAGVVTLSETFRRAHVFVAPEAVHVFDAIDRKLSPEVVVSRDSFTLIMPDNDEESSSHC